MRRAVFVLVMFIASVSDAGAQRKLRPRLEGDQVRVAAPGLRFLTGEPLERLMNGASVVFEFQLLIREHQSGKTLNGTRQRFVISYDLWEEKFAITRPGPSPRSVSHLSTAAAEAWCLDNLSVGTERLSADKDFWLRLEFSAESPVDSAPTTDNERLTLSGLVEIFSKRGQAAPSRGVQEDGPFRLSELRKMTTR